MQVHRCVWVPDTYPVFLRNHPPCLFEARPRSLISGSHCFDEWTSDQASPRDPPVSASPVLELQAVATMPCF